MYVIYCSRTQLYLNEWSYRDHKPLWWVLNPEDALQISCHELTKEVIDLMGTPGLVTEYYEP